MEEHVVNRRRVLLGTGAAAIGGVAAATTASANGDANHNGDTGLRGSWVLSRHDNAPADTSKVTTVVSFAAGNVFISQDIAPPSSAGTGTWARDGADGFRATFWFGMPGSGGPNNPDVTVRVRARGTVRGDRLSGTYQFTVFGPNGAVVQRGTGAFSGRPIEA